MTIHYFCVFTTKQAAEKEHFPGSLEAVLFPHRGWLCHSLPCFQHVLTLYCCSLCWATHRLPLSAAVPSLAALGCSEQRLWSAFPSHTPSLSLQNPWKNDTPQCNLLLKYFTLWISLNNYWLRFFSVLTDIAQYRPLAKSSCWIHTLLPRYLHGFNHPKHSESLSEISALYSRQKLIWNCETERNDVLPELQETWSYFNLSS